ELDVHFVILAIMLAGYSIAFATAFFTRQMLTGILAAVLLLIAWWVAPWLSHRLDFLQPPFMQVEAWHGRVHSDLFEMMFVIFAGGTVVIVLVSLGVALVVARREVSPRVRPKAMAWTVAAIVLLIFTLAMNEVGS